MVDATYEHISGKRSASAIANRRSCIAEGRARLEQAKGIGGQMLGQGQARRQVVHPVLNVIPCSMGHAARHRPEQRVLAGALSIDRLRRVATAEAK